MLVTAVSNIIIAAVPNIAGPIVGRLISGFFSAVPSRSKSPKRCCTRNEELAFGDNFLSNNYKDVQNKQTNYGRLAGIVTAGTIEDIFDAEARIWMVFAVGPNLSRA